MAKPMCLKMVLIGDEGVGKTSVLTRLKGERLQERMITFEAESYTKDYPELNLKLEIWDTPGSEDKRTVAAYSYQGAVGVMVFFDLSREETFNNVDNWLRLSSEYVKEDEGGNFKVFIVGSKSDLKAEDWSSTHDITHVCAKYNAKYFEVSAKDRNTEPIKQMFLEFAKSLVAGKMPEQNKTNIKTNGGMKCLIL